MPNHLAGIREPLSLQFWPLHSASFCCHRHLDRLWNARCILGKETKTTVGLFLLELWKHAEIFSTSSM